jgi:hypothetical protein
MFEMNDSLQQVLFKILYNKHESFLSLGYDNLMEAGLKKQHRQKMPFAVGHGLRNTNIFFSQGGAVFGGPPVFLALSYNAGKKYLLRSN